MEISFGYAAPSFDFAGSKLQEFYGLSSYSINNASTSAMYDGTNFYLLDRGSLGQSVYTIYKSTEPYFLTPTVTTVNPGGTLGPYYTSGAIYYEANTYLMNIDSNKMYIGSCALETWTPAANSAFKQTIKLRPVTKP